MLSTAPTSRLAGWHRSSPPTTLAEAHILVVDDEPALRNQFAKWLIRSGCPNVQTAESAHEAIGRINQGRVDVLITDVRMPVMDGVTLVRTIRNLGLSIPCIIFVTGASEIDYRELYHLGVEAFLGKPFHMEELTRALHNAITCREALWTTPMTTPPRASIQLSEPLKNLDPESASGADMFHLGRGGFSLAVKDAPGSGNISFDLLLQENSDTAHALTRLRGHGFIRWRSRTEGRTGIEFAYIEPDGRQWVVDQIRERNPPCFIPA